MGNNEDRKSMKSEKSSSPQPPDQGNIHVTSDWASMQAYYGPRVALPPYYSSPAVSGHAPHPYMWAPPQHMMPPYGAPYAAIYSPGGVYAYPAVPLGSHAHNHGVPSSPAAIAPLNTEAPTKSSGTADQSLRKKIKGLDGLAMSVGNGSAESEAEGSTDGSDGNTAGANQSRNKRSREGTSIAGGDGKSEIKSSRVPTPDKTPIISGKSVGTVLSPGMPTTLELKNASSMNAKTNSASVPQPCVVLPSETWVQNERELKRERRKQSNRESARRSRLRKQAETEELAHKVDSLSVENVSLKSEINQLSKKSEKLVLENATLLEKLKSAQLGQAHEIVINSIDEKRVTPVSIENLLSRVSNSAAGEEEGHTLEKKSNTGAKLHQLLDASRRTDAVAAG